MEKLNINNKLYRADIDGMRAIAVLAVIIFHINSFWLPGGFVGVDIFFVIFGYLINGLILDEIRRGQFTIQIFYQRRIKRILPAVWALLFISLPISWLLMLPSDAEPMAKSALWSIVGLPNIYFWREVTTEYFSPQSSQMPFLHLWSLGVEEQFYFFWPLILLALWKIFPKNAHVYGILFSALLILVSPIMAEWLISNQESRFAYYMLPTRAGELASGAFLSLYWPYLVKKINPTMRSARWLAAIGWVMILYSFIWLNENRPFPGIRSLVPTLGAVSLIAAGNITLNGRLMWPHTRPVMQWLGCCSFSAYLWHWSVLAWWRYLWGQPLAHESIIILVFVILLAAASQRWVELPARRSNMGGIKMLSLYLFFPAIIIAGMALGVARAEKWSIPIYSKALIKGLENFTVNRKPVHQLPWVCQQHILDDRTLMSSDCEFGAGDSPANILLFGDSHAAQFAPVIRRAAEIQGVRVRAVALGACAPIPGSLKGIVSDIRLKACQEGMEKIMKRADDFNILIIGGLGLNTLKIIFPLGSV